MSNYGVDSENSKIKQLSFERPNEGEVNFIVSAHSGFNHSTGFETLNRYFNHEFLNNNALDLKSKGGRGEALLGSLPYKTMALLYGPIKDLELNDDKWACRARLEFELLTELYSLGLPVPRPLIAREQVGTFLVTNDILVERIDNTNNLAELLEQKASMDGALIDEIANTIAKFAFHKVVHTDLNIRNLLINDKGQCFVIDFDKCFIKDGFTKDDLITMLNRLERSFNKEKELCHYDDLDTQVLCERLKNQALLSFERLGSAK